MLYITEIAAYQNTRYDEEHNTKIQLVCSAWGSLQEKCLKMDILVYGRNMLNSLIP
jgi:hypothetical protein